MEKDDLKCVLIGRNVEAYRYLARLVRKIDAKSIFKQVDPSESAVAATLKKISGPTLIFISDEISFSLEYLSDLVWQYCPDSAVVILTTKSTTVPLTIPFNHTQFSRIKLDGKTSESELSLQFLIQSSRDKAQFRRCKNLLGVSETRCQWLVDSSREAVAFISRDMHWYANAAYLDLFEIDSIQQLRSTTVKDLIAVDEHPLLDSFQKNQKKLINTKSAIVLSMKKKNGVSFRAQAYLIPSVFKGYKCFQLWIKEINPIENSNESIEGLIDKKPLTDKNKVVPRESMKSKIKSDNGEMNPFAKVLYTTSNSPKADHNSNELNDSFNKAELRPQKSKVKKATQPSYTAKSLLKGVIRRNEARVVANKLIYLQTSRSSDKDTSDHQLLSLKVAEAQKKGVDKLLTDLPERYNSQMLSVFWDKVKILRLLQILIKRENITSNLIVRINESSISDETFVSWLVPGLEKLGDKSSKLVFLIPSNIDESQHINALALIKILRSYQCRIALDSFSNAKESIDLLKKSHPEYLRLSLPWVRQLYGNESKEIRLSSMVRQLESHKIKVIAPCSFSKNMRRLFVLSGASFCQETLIKTA